VAYIGFASELKDPRDFKWALFVQQAVATVLYSIVGCVIYYYAGPNVPSPAISAAQPYLAKAAYIVASLTIVVAGVVNAHVACKCIYLRWFPKIIQEKSFKSLGIWVGIVAACWIFAWIMAEAIPSFPYMLGIVSAGFSGWFSCKCSGMMAAADDKLTERTDGVSGMFWLHMNRGRLLSSKGKIFLTCLNSAVIVMGLLIVSCLSHPFMPDVGSGLHLATAY
jgi:hypothetical protein